MRRTRVAVALLVAVLIGAGCGSDDDEAADSTSAATIASTAVPVTTAPATTGPATTAQATATPDTVASTDASTATTAGPSAAACAGVSADVVDLTRLPVGDDKIADAPTCDFVFSCQHFGANAPGAQAAGPWFNGDGTWDSTAKLTVSGSVEWDHSLDISVSGEDRLISTNDLPDHPTGEFPIGADDPVSEYDRNPNAISEQSVEYTLPATPSLGAEPTCVGGTIGVLLTGVLLFSAFDAGGRDAKAWEAQDNCQGHPQDRGMYHYHALTSCVDDPGTRHSALLGYAFDGFGIYGMRGEDGSTLTNADLDECHGHTHTITWDGAEVEMYHYHATAEFPYVIGCYRATPINTGP